MWSLFRRALATALLLVTGPAWACVVLDQMNGWHGFGYSTSSVWQQEVKVRTGGWLVRLDLYVMEAPHRFFIDIYATGGAHEDPHDRPLLELLVEPDPGSGWNEFDLRPLALRLWAGETFTFGIRGLGGEFDCCGLAGSDPWTGRSYADGRLFHFDGQRMFEFTGMDLAFRTFFDVPEPGQPLLVLTALAALAVGRRRMAARLAGVGSPAD